MQSLREWGQGDGAPAHLQVVQGPVPNCPTGTHIGEGCEARIANIVAAEHQNLEGWECPTSTGRSEGGEAHIANLITVQADVGAISQRPTGTCINKGLHPFVTYVIVAQEELLKRSQRMNGTSEDGRPTVADVIRHEVELCERRPLTKAIFGHMDIGGLESLNSLLCSCQMLS